jgi:DMSO/TMAO reductase YedYZ molybdopterin-dependent catalytic subunit
VVEVNRGERTSAHTDWMPEPREGVPIGRAAFLGLVAAGISSLAWGKPAFDALARAVPSGLPSLAPSGGLRIYSISNPLPVFDPATYRLQIFGLVDRPFELSYADLQALPQERQVSDFHCVTGWSVENVHWEGVRIRELLKAAKLGPSARALRFNSAELPYDSALTLEQALLPDVMLALKLDGKPLTRAHGAPVRLVIPEMYGYKGVKWLKSIEVSREAFAGYWEREGYDNDAWVGRSNGYGDSA